MNPADLATAPFAPARPVPASAPAVAPAVAPALSPTRRRRRPSGEPPPLPRAISASGRSWLVLTVVVVAFLVVVILTRRTAVALNAVDHSVLDAVVGLRRPWSTPIVQALGTPARPHAVQVIWFANLLVLAVWKRWRHLVIWVVAGLIVNNVVGNLVAVVQRPRPFGVEILGPWSGYAMPSMPMAMLAAFAVSTLYANVPAGRPRSIGKVVVVVLLAVVAGSRLYLAQEAPSDAVFGAVLGTAVPLVAFRLFAPNPVFPVTYRRRRTAHLPIDEPRRLAIETALLDQLGLLVTDVTPFGLEGSGGSTPLRIGVKSEEGTPVFVFAKLYAMNHLRSDRWYKLGRTLLYGRLEDEKPFNTVRRLVQYEDYILRLLHEADLPVPRSHGIVELTPEREYLLVTDFFDGATEMGEADIDVEVVDQGLNAVRRMWEIGVAHRDIKPANLLVREGRLLVIDSAFAQVRPSPWRQAVDLANMMLVLALRVDARTVFDRARLIFTDDEIVEAFAATRGLTMPSQLRRFLRSEGEDLHAEFLTLLPYQVAPVRIQRWSLRRVGLSASVLVAGGLTALLALQLLVSSPL